MSHKAIQYACACGGAYRRVVLPSFDFLKIVGIPHAVQDVPGLRCDGCGQPLVDGHVVAAELARLATCIDAAGGPVTGTEARFLRKRLRLTPAALAATIGDVTPAEVAGWERRERLDAETRERVCGTWRRVRREAPSSLGLALTGRRRT